MSMSLAILYLASRAWDLLRLPPFVDELLYLRWTQSISISPQNFWLPVAEDGQPPLFFWLAALLKYLTHLDTLLILRSLSVLFGLLVLIILVNLGTKLFSRQVGLFLGFIYTIFPMFLWYDRLAMRESLITLAGLVVIYGLANRLTFQIKSASYLIVLGFLLGIMTKGTAIMFVPVIVVSFILYYHKIKLNKHDLVAGLILAVLLTLLYFGGHSIIAKGETFLLSFSSIKDRLYQNLYSTIRWIIEYSTLPVAMLGLFGLSRLAYQKHNSVPLLLTVLLVTLGIEIISASIYFPRYFLWALISWIIFVSYGASWVASKRFGWLALFIIFVPSLIFDYQLITTPASAPLPAIERWQYITGWPAGYGIEDLAKGVSKIDIDVLVVEPNEACKSGLPYYGASDYALLTTHELDQIQTALEQNKHVYLCLNVSDKFEFDGISEFVQKVDRPDSESSLRLYQLTKNNL